MNIFRIGRIANAIAGAWLFLSAMLLDRTPQQAANAAVVGALVAALALVSLYRLPFLRFASLPLAVWLFFSAWFPDRSAATVANDMLVATWIFGFGAIPTDLDEDELRVPRAVS